MNQLIITIFGYFVVTIAAYQLGKNLAIRNIGLRCLELNKLCMSQLDRLRNEVRTPDTIEMLNLIAVVLDANNYVFGVKTTPPDLTKKLFEDDSVSSNP